MLKPIKLSLIIYTSSSSALIFPRDFFVNISFLSRRHNRRSYPKMKFICVCVGYEFLSRIASSVLRVNCYRINEGPAYEVLVRLIAHLDTGVVHTTSAHSRQPPLWYIDCHFSKLWYDSAVTQNHNLQFWWRALYPYKTSRTIMN